jgi:hypothetical protein
MGFRETFVGDEERYDYMSMCLPQNPFGRGEKPKLNFYGKGR